MPPGLLLKGRQKVEFHLTGRGRYTYQCLLAGFVPVEKIKSTSSDWELERRYEPAPLERDGRFLHRGFGIIQGSAATFHNPLTQIPVGRPGFVELTVRRKSASADRTDAPPEYLLITEPIPSGVTINPASIQGGFDRFERSPGTITFYVSTRRKLDPIRYELDGYLPGRYRAGPTVLRHADRPDQLAAASPAVLTVLPPGAASGDKYRLSPEELLELGRITLAKRDFRAAAGHLEELMQQWDLAPFFYKQAIGMLLDAYLQIGDPAKIVHYMEIVISKWPEQEIPFDTIMKVGAAYHQAGEFERSYLVYRDGGAEFYSRERNCRIPRDAGGVCPEH